MAARKRSSRGKTSSASRKRASTSSSGSKSRSSNRSRTTLARSNGSTSRGSAGRSRSASRSAGRSPQSSSSSRSRVLTDRDEIRQWAEERNARPACVRGTGSNTGPSTAGMIRLDFPGDSGETSLEAVDWKEWFKVFGDRDLALLVQDETARGERSNFNKLVSRETAGQYSEKRTSRSSKPAGRRSRAA